MRVSFRRSEPEGVRGTLAPVSRWGAGGRFAAMRHPLFLAALVVLVVNDHVLKGAGVLPGWLTGKLSDLAGLVVAPVLVAAVIGAKTARGRAAAFAAVAGPFAAIKLSAAAASALVLAAKVVGLRFRIWQDPTDLLAFVALLPAWRLASSAVSAQGVTQGFGARALAAGSPRLAVWSERAVLGAAAAACVATSQGTVGGYSTSTYLVNATGRTVDVRVRWVDAALDCPRVMANGPARMLGPSAFTLGITFRLDDGATVPLGRWAAFEASGQGGSGEGATGGGGDSGTGGSSAIGDPGGTGGSCEVALIESSGVLSTLVYWDSMGAVSVPVNANGNAQFWQDPALRRGRVILAPGALLTPGDVKQAALERTVAKAECDGAEQVAYQWSVPVEATGTPVYLHEVGVLPDGCAEMSIGYLPTDAEDGIPDMIGYVCIPEGELPFGSGAHVMIHRDDSYLEILDEASSKTLWVFHGKSDFSTSGLSIAMAKGACEGDRLSCGAYAAPATIVVAAAGTTTSLRPGEEVSGKDFHVRLGRAEDVIVGRDGCEAGYDVPGLTADFLVSYE